METGVKVDVINAGTGYGGVAEKLMLNRMDVSSLRTNAVLTYDEWKDIDTVVLQEAHRRLGGVNDLISAGLVRTGGGLGSTVLQWQDISDTDGAEVNMDGVSRGAKDRFEVDTNYLPLPIIHRDFGFSIREIEASRNRVASQPLDLTMAEEASRKVAEKAEDILFNGLSAYSMGTNGGTIRGYTDHPDRNTQSLSQNWDASGKTGQEILTDVLNAKQALINDRHFGPFMLYIPTAYETVLDDEFSTQYPRSIRSRILELDGLKGVKVSDFLTANNVVLVSMQSTVVRIVEGLPLTTVQWDTEGGMQVNFKVMTILVPQIRSTQANRSGIVHIS
ncbi:MAG: family 1 encapsulin nanocompartment shell protein [Flavobacteriales bacterium]|jgi:uncharacterized linocin/CFP29 family protein|nr:family 1 encapsulin nanocompartment shell protein [Flavobacteriales bacterium]|tara:strand:- start:5574 stop:6572 length:999 start_codon:yes stop_codon:yes gene_type:complete